MKIPFNRFVAFVKPYINLGAGALAAYLVAKLNVVGIPGLGEHQNELATGLAAVGVAGVTWLGTQLADLKWLKGHHIDILATAEVQKAALSQPLNPPVGPVDGEDLPSDDEEFASPPPDSATTPDTP